MSNGCAAVSTLNRWLGTTWKMSPALMYSLHFSTADSKAGWSKFDGSSTFDQDSGVAIPTSFTTGAIYQANNTVASKYKNYSHELELQSTGSHTIDWQAGLWPTPFVKLVR